MAQFIATNILMLSFGSILYLIARALPRVEEADQPRRGIFERLFASGIPERVDTVARAFFLKFLRKSKVYVLKIENYITEHLQKMSSENTSSPFGTKADADPKQTIDFKEILDEKNEKEGKF